MTPLPFWLMIVSRATAVLPVWRSPMMSSRWPRPMGTMPSIGLDAGLERLLDGLAVDDAGGDALDRAELRGRDRALAVDGLAERVHHAADHARRRRDGHDARRALDLVAFLDELGLAEEHRAHRVLLEVQGQGHDPVGKLEQLAGHALLEAVDARDAVAHGQDGARLGGVDPGGEARRAAPG